MNWVMMDWDGHNMRLNNNWIGNFNRNVDRERNLHFSDDWDFDFLVDWILFNMVMVNGVHMIGHRDLDVFTGSEKTRSC